jgi:hypothetical protein
MKKTSLGRIAGIAASAFIVVLMTPLLAGCRVEPDDPTVTSVTVAPAMATAVKGDALDFTATVAVTDGAAQTVTWTLEGTQAEGTKIEEIATGGRLTVASAEAATTLTVKATSTVDSTKFGTATVTIVAVNKTALTTAITAATAAKDGVVVNTAAANVPAGTKWVTKAVFDTFNAVITTAETVKNNADVAQTEVDNATAVLTTATTTFTTAIQTAATTNTVLATAITVANTAKTGVVISVDGKDKAPGTKWVTQTEMTTLTTAITEAQAVQDNAAAAQTTVDTAVTTLTTATTAFTTAIHTATTTKTALATAITAATAAKSGVETSEDGKDKVPGTKWVTGTVMTALTTALSAAETVRGNDSATQTEVDTAVTTLTTATTAFTPNTAITDKTALTTAISTANTAKANVTSSATDPGAGTKWVLPADLTAFNTAITTAETVNANANATQTEVDAAVTALNTAKDTFNGQVKNVTHGTNSITVNFWQSASDGAILTSSANITITSAQSLTATVTSAYTNVQWYVDGILVPNGTTAAITISGATYIDDLGIHRLGVMVITDGAYYSKELTFTVTD